MNPLDEVLKDGPRTTIGTENGQVVITVEASHLKPFDAKIADIEAVVIAWALVIGGIWLGIADTEMMVPAGILFLGGICGRGYLINKSRESGEVVTTVRFTESGIAVKPSSWWNPNTPWQSFDSRVPHRFVRLPHDRAQYERDEHEYQRTNAPGVRLTRYYSDAFIIVLEQLGQRYDIAEVMSAQRADAILARLALCDEYMKDIANKRKRLAITPADQWPQQTGSVPQ